MNTPLFRRFIFVLLPQCHLLDLAGMDQVIYELKDAGHDVSMCYCSTHESVRSSNGLQISALEHFSTVRPTEHDVLVVPGAESKSLLSSEFKKQREFLSWLGSAHRAGSRICSVCTGAFALAQAGLLDGRDCTTHWQCTEILRQHFPLAKVRDNVLYCEDSGVMTSAGVSSGIDLALQLVTEAFGEKLAFRIARQLVVYTRRSAESSQLSPHLVYRNHIHSAIHAVQDYMWQNIGQALLLEDLAEIACMSTRSLTRSFRMHTGISIGQYLRLLREDKARGLLQSTDMTRSQIAQACGLRSERQLQRILYERNATLEARS